MNKYRNKELNQLVVNYQSKPTAKLELVIWDNVKQLINSIIFQIVGHQTYHNDLLNEAYIKFKYLLNKYDITTEINFQSYIYHPIRQLIYSTINTNYKIKAIKLPEDYSRAYAKSLANKPLSNSEKAMLAIQTQSLSQPINEDGATVEDTIPGTNSPQITEYETFEEIYFQLIKPLLLTQPRGRGRQFNSELNSLIFEINVGLNADYEGLTIYDIAELTNISAARVNQIVIHMRKKIKKIITENQAIKEYIEEIIPNYSIF